MKVVVFGATGSIGREVVKQALEQGHIVTAFSRHSARLDIQHENLKIVSGDVMDLAVVERAIQGQDAVLAALGSSLWKDTNVRSEGNRNIIRAMEKLGIRRLVTLSTLGTGESWPIIPLKYKILFSTLLRKVFADHEAQENVVKQSQLDWIIVRPGEYTNGSRTGKYRHGFPFTEKTVKAEISRADVADFMLKQLTDNSYLHQTPGISY